MKRSCHRKARMEREYYPRVRIRAIGESPSRCGERKQQECREELGAEKAGRKGRTKRGDRRRQERTRWQDRG